ncbi:MAG: hypothetical protein KDB14_31180 [Planctomycetales bacterium]|nr:hypothetical protein [Planctomycetales bacterium]
MSVVIRDDDPLLAPTFLFRFSAPLRRYDLTTEKLPTPLQLGEEYRLPNFAELEGRPAFAELRAAWGPRGLLLQLWVRGKRQSVWCRESRPEDSDGLQVLIDTRDTKSIHRAGRFQHSFYLLPQGSGRGFGEGAGVPMAIPRCRELPAPAPTGSLQVRSRQFDDGYQLDALVAASALTGWDPEQHARIGFSYLLRDRELGHQAFTIGDEFPVTSDPSLWGSLDLLKDGAT